MEKNFSFCLLLLCLTFSGKLFAQHPTCDGIRYLNPVFPSLDSIKDIQFGANDNAWNFNTDLFMDIYLPAGDTAARRPALVFAFGEGFLSGERADVAGICRTFATYGYVVANIDYRIYPGLFFTDSSQTVDAAIKATQDVKAAVRFLREDAATANQYRIDPDFIFAGGVSSGAIASCYTAYMDTSDAISPLIQTLLNDNGGLEGSSNTLARSSAVQGVINWSGGLKDDEMMDANDAPIASAHDTGDAIVPFGSGNVVVGLGVTIFFEGSATLKARADALGISNSLYAVNSNDHAGYLSHVIHFPAIFQEALDMMYAVLCPPVVTGLAENSAPGMQLFPNPAVDQVHARLDAGVKWESVLVLNVLGQVVGVGSVDHGQGTLQLANLQSGIYWVRARSVDGQFVVGKLRLGWKE